MSSDKFMVEVSGPSRPGCRILRASGVLDAESAPIIEAAFRNLFEKGIFNIIVDLGQVDFISSAGWGVFTGDLKSAREHGGDIQLVNLPPDVLDIFLLLELDHFIRYHDRAEDALRQDEEQEVAASSVEPVDDETAHTSSEMPSEDIEEAEETAANAEIPAAVAAPPPDQPASGSPAVDVKEPVERVADSKAPAAFASSPPDEQVSRSPAEPVDPPRADERGSAPAFPQSTPEPEGESNRQEKILPTPSVPYEMGALRLRRTGERSNGRQFPLDSESRVNGLNGETVAGGKWGLWRHIFHRRSLQPRDDIEPGEQAPEAPSFDIGDQIRWEARRGSSRSNLSFRPPLSDRHSAPLPSEVGAPVDGNGARVDAENGSLHFQNLGSIAAVIQEDPTLGPRRIKRRLDELSGGDCNLSVTTIYRRLRAARLNTRDRRVNAVRTEEQDVR